MTASRRLFGLLNVNKPADVTSRHVVDRVVRAVKPAKAGHAGTLDPMATGVLVVCIGRATRLIPYVQQQPKTYVVEFQLGRQSNTDDITGDVTNVGVPSPPDRQQVEQALASFVGTIEQVPPQFSAVHVGGRRAYKLARKGEAVQLPPRTVEVYRIELTHYDFPNIKAEIECGSGTYVRSIVRDVGRKLDTAAVMSRLTRTAIGPFQLADSVNLDCLSADSVADQLLHAAPAVSELPQYTCTRDDLNDLQHGRRIRCAGSEATVLQQPQVAVLSPDGRLVAIAEPVSGTPLLAPRQVFWE